MGLRFPAQIYGRCFFTTTTFKDWRNFGDIPGFYGALTDSLIFYSRKYQVNFIGYVLMPSHLHLILLIDGEKLSGFMRDFKKFIAQKAASDLGLGKGAIWKPRYNRVVINSEKVLLTKLNYLHDNPVKSGLVNNPEDWKWSSAKDNILGEEGIIPLLTNWN